MNDVLSKPLKHDRFATGRGRGKTDPEGGAYGAGIIRDVAVVTNGEALGHDLWVDDHFTRMVSETINASETGLKVRLAHPGLSSDGIGTQVGKLRDGRYQDGQAFADIHMIPSAHRAPDGNLAEYVMGLQADAPEDFGMSIVFDHDIDAEDAFTESHIRDGRFQSPDTLNTKNLRHARFEILRGADVVDEPAANPGGLFQRKQELAADGEHILDYALGLSDAKPVLQALNADPDRIAGFVKRYLSRHNLEVRKAGDPVSEQTTDPAEVVEAQPTREELAVEFRQELKRFTEAFGAEYGTEWFNEGASYSDAQGRYIEKLNQQISARDAKIDELSETLSSLNRGETEPADFSDGNAKASPAGLNKKIRISGKSYPDEN